MSNILEKSSYCSATVNISYFQQAKKWTKEKLSALGKVLQSPQMSKWSLAECSDGSGLGPSITTHLFSCD